MEYHVDPKKHIIRSIDRLLKNEKEFSRDDRKYVIYPFGIEGMIAKSVLNIIFGIKEHMIIDNYLSDKNNRIINLNDLDKMDTSDLYFLICSDRLDIYDELRKPLYEKVPKRQCFELLPRPISYERACIPFSKDHMGLTECMFREATIDSAHFINENLRNARVFPNRWSMLENSLIEEVDERLGLIMEFGVYKGRSINFISSLMSFKEVLGFDSFEGLPVDWFAGFTKGSFGIKGEVPTVNENVRIIKGWFDQTLPEFLKTTEENVSFIHIDCDVYESTKTVLECLANRIVSGTIILFDEYLNRPGWRNHEHRAWQEFVDKNNVQYEYYGFVSDGYDSSQVAVKIL